MKNKIVLILAAFAVLPYTVFALETVYSIQAKFFRNDTAALEFFEVAEGTPTDLTGEGAYSIEIMAGSRAVFESKFQMNFQSICATGGVSNLKKGEKVSVNIDSKVYSVEFLGFGNMGARFTVNGVTDVVNTGSSAQIAGLTIFLSKLDAAADTAEVLLYEEPKEGEDPEEKCPVQEQVTGWHRLPFFEKADKIVIKHGDKKLLTIDIPKYVCRKDGKCEEYENEALCPEECGVERPEKPAPKPTDTGGQPEDGGLPLVPIAGAVISLAVLGFFLYRKSQRGQEQVFDQQVYQ